MPFASQAQQRFAFGTGQPWAERWAKETDFAHLPKRTKRKARKGRKWGLKSATTYTYKRSRSPAEYRAIFAKLSKGKKRGGGKGAGPAPAGKPETQEAKTDALAHHSPELDRALNQVERSISINPFETMIALDAHGNRVATIEGALHEVSIPANQAAQLKGAVLTHNHPHNVSFSPADVQVAIEHELGEMRAVTGDHRYSLRVPAGTKWTPTLDASIKADYKRRLDQARADVASDKRTIKDVNRNLHHELWSDFAKAHGWHYSRESWA